MAKRKAPPDECCEGAWDKIMAIAEEHMLIIQAGGGVATLVLPKVQRDHGLREQVLAMNLGEEAEPPK